MNDSLANDIALNLINDGHGLNQSVNFAACAQVFFDHHRDALADAIRNGEDPEAVMSEFMNSLKVFAQKNM